MKEKIREFIFKLFQKQILGFTYKLNPHNFIAIKETRFDWVKLRAQVSQVTHESLRYMKSPQDEVEHIRRELVRLLSKEISNIIEIEKVDWINSSYPPSDMFMTELYVARKAK